MNYQHPRLVFDEKTHTYLWDGVKKPSVTGILSSVAVNGKPIADTRWFGEDDTARNFGHAFHKMAAMIWRGQGFDIPDAMAPWCESMMKFKKEFKFLRPFISSIDSIECPMYHEALGFCGTPDLIAEVSGPCPVLFKNAIVVLDWKTSTREMGHWQYQTAAYMDLFKAASGLPCGGMRPVTMSVRFDEKGPHVKTRVGSEIKADWNYFLSCLNVYKGAV
jgi:hypothetical protein